MSIFQKIKSYFNTFRTDTFSIRNKGSWLNYTLIIVGVIGVFILLLGNFFVKDKIIQAHTKVGSFHNLNTSNEVKVDKWEWNKNKETLDVILSYKDKDQLSENEEEYSYKFNANDNPKKNLEYKVISKTDNKVALRTYGVKKGFEVVGLTIYGKNKSSNDSKEKQIVMLANERKVEISKSNKLNDKKHYLLEFIDNDIDNVEKEIRKKEKNIDERKSKISRYNTQISNLDDKKAYQTSTEKQNTESKIDSIRDEIKEEEMYMNQEKDKQKEDKESLKLLKKKHYDTELFTD